MAISDAPLKVMVSSTVYSVGYLLQQIEATLKGFGYEPIMSAQGSMFVNPDLGNFDNCLEAVNNCDLFFSIITPAYGSGLEEKGGLSITHREIIEAIRLDKPRWTVCHQDIFTARSLLNDLSYGEESLKGAEGRAKLTLRPGASILKDLKVIDMLEAATREDIKNVADRRGNWVQSYANEGDVLKFVQTQFGEDAPIRAMLAEREVRRVARAVSATEAVEMQDGAGKHSVGEVMMVAAPMTKPVSDKEGKA